MNESRAHRIYSAREILAYLQGRMPALEQHALERQALEDPLLWDAVEGYRQALERESEEALLARLDQVRAQSKRDTVTPLPAPVVPLKPSLRRKWWQYAAAAAIVGMAGWWIFQISRPDQVLPPGLQDVTPYVEPKQAEASETDQSQESTTPSPVAKPEPPPTPDPAVKAAPAQEEQQALRKETSAPAAVPPQPAPPVADKAAPQSAPAEPETAKPRAAEAQRAQPVILAPEIARLRSNGDRTLRGKVLDEEGKPIANAKLMSPETQVAATTDAQGRFWISVPDSLSKLIVVAEGFDRQEQRIMARDSIVQITLSAEEDLQDAIVTKLLKDQAGKASVRMMIATDTLQASPVYGWEDFSMYVFTARKTPRNAMRPPVEVPVEIVLNANGELQSVKLLGKVPEPYGEEALRLLKEGPPWQSKTGGRARARMKLLL